MALYIVPTPIGNLGDITRRAVEVLSGVGFIIAEDSRYTLKLLNHLGIRKRIVSHYRPKEAEQADKIVAMLAAGEDGALVTDSGTPAISDPGFILVRRAIDAGIPVVPLPGPTAFVPALAASGIDAQRFLFLGFPPRRRGELSRFLKELAPLPYTLIFYESPRRLEDFLEAAAAEFGDREFALAKEVSKKHEKIVRSRLGSWRASLQDVAVLGEMVVVIAGLAGGGPKEDVPHFADIDDLYAFFQQRFGIGKNALKKVLMKKKDKGRARRIARVNERFDRRLVLALALLLAMARQPLPGKAQDAGDAPAKGGFVIAPVAYYTPETRLAWGLVGIHYFRLGSAKPPARLSHYRFNLTRTQNKQSIAQVDFELYLAGGKFLLGGSAKYANYPGRFYGIGNRTIEEERENFTSRSWRLQLEPQLRWGRSFYTGLHLETQSVSMRETQSGGVLAAATVPGSAGGSMTGAGVFAKWDSRDNTFSARRGSYAAVFLNRFFRALGSDYSYGQLAVDGRGYWALGRRGPVLAVQGVFKSVWGGCPFQVLPMFGGLNLLRGYYDGRYRDRTMLALQGECRLPLGNRFGLCGFAGIAQVQKKVSLLELHGFHAAGGAGVRYTFNRRENLILRLDAGFAGFSGAPAFYLTFAEAF